MNEEWVRGAPGSDEARAAGCQCPVLDNGYGRGLVLDGKRVWWQVADCPVHQPQAVAS